jgi:hypothetical protein
MVTPKPSSLSGMSARPLLAAAFSSVYCVLASSIYFSIRFWLRSGDHLSGLIVNVFWMLLVPAAAFGLFLGAIGAMILDGFSFFTEKAQKMVAAAVLGGFLGCVPPAAFPPPQDFETPLAVLPCILIGSTCAIAWTLLSLKRTPPQRMTK